MMSMSTASMLDCPGGVVLTAALIARAWIVGEIERQPALVWQPGHLLGSHEIEVAIGEGRDGVVGKGRHDGCWPLGKVPDTGLTASGG